MNTNKIFTRIKAIGHDNTKKDELQEFCKQNYDEIIELLPRHILNSDGCDLLDCIFNGLPAKSKVKVTDLVLLAMRKEATSLRQCSDIISRICLELPRLPSEELVRYCNESLQSIVDDSDVNMIWKDILPECFTSIFNTNCQIKHCGTDMTPTQFKEQCVRTLCQCSWKEKQLMQLAAMFKDMQLSRSDHKQVVNKLCLYLVDVPPDTLPPLVHQMLKLCSVYDVEIVLAHLSHYFSLRLYSKLEPPPQDSESTTEDIEEFAPYNTVDLSRCLSTCLYHISHGPAEPQLIRKHLKSWPKSNLLRNPFLIDVMLALPTKGAERTVCLDVIRSAIEQREMDEYRSKESAWVRSVLPPDVDVAGLLKVLTTESANHRQLTVPGLIALAFRLLAVPKQRPTAGACWMLGELVLVRVCKAQPETAPTVLAHLADRMPAEILPQHADLLYVLCKLAPVSVLRCPQLSAILESVSPSAQAGHCARAALAAVRPLLNCSTRTRDTLLMLCRKSLFSRDSQHRCLALSGILCLLKHIKLPLTLSGSQSVCSEQFASSYLTQCTLDLHSLQTGAPVTSGVRNEAMCLEVVSILRRCLVQDAAVKQLLYTELYDCTKEKPAIHEPILDIVYEHFSKFLPEEGSEASPLLFDKCVQMSAINAVLIEPIPHLLYCISQFLQRADEEDLEDILSSQPVDESAHLKTKLMMVMNALCGREELLHVDMDDPGLTDLTPESKAKSIKVQLVLQCYESLIAHQIMQWRVDSGNVASLAYRLYKAHSELLDKTKVPSKNKKGAKSALNDTKEATKSQKSQKSQKDKGKAATKISNLVKDRAGPFKPLPCLWDLSFCVRIVELLYSEEVSWSSLEQRNHIRARRDFHHFALRCVREALAKEHLEKHVVAHYAVKIARIMYARCLSRFQEMCVFDDQTALSCMDVFRDCLTLLFSSNYRFKIDRILPTITGTPESNASTCIAIMLEKIHHSLAQIEEDSDNAEGDALSKKTAAVLMQTATVLLDKPTGESCTRLCNVIVKLEDYARTCKSDCLPLIPSLLNANCSVNLEAQFLDDLIIKLTHALGRIDEEDTSAGQDTSMNFPHIDESRGHAALAHVCAHLATRGKYCEQLIARSKELQAAGDCATAHIAQKIRKELKELSKSLTIQLCEMTSRTSRIAKLRCCVGSGSDKVLTSLIRLYCLLSAFVKQIDVEMLQDLRLERLLKLSGKKLSSIADNLITYLEASQPQEQGASKVLRDTKHIPRLVLEAEQFTKHVLLASNKAKLNLGQYMPMGTARDFRIKAPVLQEVLNAMEPRIDETSNSGDETVNEADQDALSASSDDEQQENRRGTQPKRRRVS